MSANPSRKLLRRRIRQDHPGALGRKPVGVWGWRVAHGAWSTRATTAGGRAHAAGAHVQRHTRWPWRASRPISSKSGRRAYIARRIKEIG